MIWPRGFGLLAVYRNAKPAIAKPQAAGKFESFKPPSPFYRAELLQRRPLV